MSFKIALITGTGMNELFSKENGFQSELDFRETTPFGGPVRYHTVRGNGLEFLWVDRHNSTGRYCCPHEINPMAYMYVLAQQKVQYIIATTAVGGINQKGMKKIGVGSLVIPEDLIDLTGRSSTFADVKYAHPTAFYRSSFNLFCPKMAELFQKTEVQCGGILTCIPGPRYETLAEIVYLSNLHPKVRLLGMTSAGEAALAREIAVHYCPVAIVADMPWEESAAEGTFVEETVHQARRTVLNSILQAMPILQTEVPHWGCDCIKKPSVFRMLNT